MIASPSTTPLFAVPDSIRVALILLPGFVLWWAHTHFGRRRTQLDEATRVAVSVLVGIALLPFSYFFLVLFSSVVGGERFALSEIPETSAEFNAVFDLPAMFAAYALTLVTALAVGALTGSMFDRFMRERYLRRQTKTKVWDYLHLHAVSPTLVEVTLSDKETVRGALRYAGEEDRDLIVQNPRSVSTTDGEPRFEKLGGAMYLRSDEVKQLTVLSNLDTSKPVSARSFVAAYVVGLWEKARRAVEGQPTEPGVVERTVEHTEEGPVVHCVVENRTDARFAKVTATATFESPNHSETERWRDWTEELNPGQQWRVSLGPPDGAFPTFHGVTVSSVPKLYPTVKKRSVCPDEGDEKTLVVDGVVRSEHEKTALAYVETLWKAYDVDGVVVDIETVGVEKVERNERRRVTARFEGVDRKDIDRVTSVVTAYWPITSGERR